ncbi:MAG: T9SS type A sorting domain-containing protein [Bacteroidales bacterium]
MRHLQLLLAFNFLLIVGYGQSISSSVIASGGGSSEAGGLNLSYTIGELAIETFTTTNMVLTQGFQQGYYDITSVNDPLVQSIDLEIYPNPAIDFISIEIKNTEVKFIQLELYSIDGVLVTNEKWENTGTPYKFELNRFSANQYILKVIDLENKNTSTFKIIKR